MTVRNIRFAIKSIEIYYDGDEFVDEGTEGRAPYTDDSKFDNIVEATLEYPRSGAALVTTSKMMDLPSRHKVKPNQDDFWESGLFKEDIDTETRFKLLVSDRDSVSKVGNWFRRIISAVFDTVIGGKVKAISNLFQGAVASDLQSSLVDSIKGKQKDKRIQALCASKEINIDVSATSVSAFYKKKDGSKVDVLSGTDMTLDLYATADIEKFIGRVTQSGTHIKKKETEVVFEKGDKIGQVVIGVLGS